MTPQDTAQRERLDRSDFRFLAICGALFVACLVFSLRNFDAAFPEASIQFRVDGKSSEKRAIELLSSLGLAPARRMHSVEFDHDDQAKIFLERSLGIAQSTALMGDRVAVWYWSHRWFTPLETEELQVRISPSGKLVGFRHVIEENAAAPAIDPSRREALARSFLAANGIDTGSLSLVSVSEKTMPRRLDAILTFEHRDLRPAGAPYELTVTLQGDRIGGFSQRLRVPDKWSRDYASLRSRNGAANDVASIFLTLTALAALVVYVTRLRRDDIHVRYSLTIGAICAVLVTLVTLNSFPSALAGYDTRTSFAAFVAQEVGFALLGGVGLGLFLMVIVGAGDALQRERLPGQIAVPRLWSTASFGSKRVFKGFVLGFTLVALFLAYQVAFYLVADRFGAWAPAEIPYDETLNTLFPWAAVLFIGFFPAFSEEYMSRAFSIPLLDRLTRSRVAAIVASAYIWGFAHSSYPNQPFFIRGIEVGTAGVILGFVFLRFGLLPCLVWHYTVDALYTSLLLFRSGNAYYVASAGICTFVFAIPLMISAVLYLRRGGFEPDSPLENAAIGTKPPLPPKPEEAPVALPDIAPLRRGAVACALAIAIGGALVATQLPPPLTSVVDYRIGPGEAIAIARAHLAAIGQRELPARAVAFPSAGFRFWDDTGGRGGAPAVYDREAADQIARTAPRGLRDLETIMRADVPAATWKVRFFTPEKKEEVVVEIDPRTAKPLGRTRVIEDDAPGASLDRAGAIAIAKAALPSYGLDGDALALKDAVAVPQKNRRDWVFHWEAAAPLAPDTFERVDVRVSGDTVTHAGRTVRLAEKTRRAATESRAANMALLLARIAGGLALLVLSTTGIVHAARSATSAWRVALKWTLVLAIPAALAALPPLALLGRAYDTSVPWKTFVARQGLAGIEGLGLQLFLVFLCLSGIVACAPWAVATASSAGRARLGRDAVARSLVALAMLAGLFEIDNALELWSRAGIDVSLPANDLVALPFPSLVVLWRATMVACLAGAAILGYSTFVENISPKRRALVHVISIVSLSLLLVDHTARRGEIGQALLQSLVVGAALFLAAWFLVRENLLAVPLAALAWSAGDHAIAWIRMGRGDLVVNATFLCIVVASAYLACWLANRRAPERPAM